MEPGKTSVGFPSPNRIIPAPANPTRKAMSTLELRAVALSARASGILTVSAPVRGLRGKRDGNITEAGYAALLPFLRRWKDSRGKPRNDGANRRRPNSAKCLAIEAGVSKGVFFGALDRFRREAR